MCIYTFLCMFVFLIYIYIYIYVFTEVKYHSSQENAFPQQSPSEKQAPLPPAVTAWSCHGSELSALFNVQRRHLEYLSYLITRRFLWSVKFEHGENIAFRFFFSFFTVDQIILSFWNKSLWSWEAGSLYVAVF